MLFCNKRYVSWAFHYLLFSNTGSCEPKLIFSREAKNKNRASRFFPDNKSNVFHVLHLCLCFCRGLRRADVCDSNRVPALPPICTLLFHRPAAYFVNAHFITCQLHAPAFFLAWYILHDYFCFCLKNYSVIHHFLDIGLGLHVVA